MIPTNLDLEKLLKETNSPLKIGYLTYIVGLLNSIPARTKDLYDDGNEFIPINVQELKKKVRDYKPYLQFLFDNDIIRSNHQFIVGERATGYQFTDNYLFAPQDWKEIEGYTLLKSLNKVDPFQIRMSKKYKYIKSCMNDDLKIDASAALDYNNDLYNYNSSFTDDQFEFNRYGRIERKDINARLRYRANEIALKEMEAQKWRFMIDKNVGRCHTNLTNIKSDFRNFITYAGQPLVSVDLKNSQPLLSGLLFNPKFYSADTENTDLITFGKVMKERRSINKSIYNKIQEISLFIILLNNQQSIGGKGFQEYLNLVQSGDFYDYYSEAIATATGEVFENRKQVKTEFLRTAYSRNGFISQPSAIYKRVFRDMATEVYKVFYKYKAGDHTLLPRLLQCIESFIFLDLIAKRIKHEYRSMPIFPIHDSIVCPLGEEGKVKAIMTEEIIKSTGMSPTFKVELWNPASIEKPWEKQWKAAA